VRRERSEAGSIAAFVTVAPEYEEDASVASLECQVTAWSTLNSRL
jgi:hypothetical protein